MIFVISSSILSARLQAIGRVIIAKNNLPILDSFLFDIQDKTLTITASDNETTIKTSTELNESDGNFKIAINAKTIQDSIKEIPEQPLKFSINEETKEITVSYQNGQYNFMGHDAGDYPTPPAITDNVKTLTLSTDDMLSGLSRALFATAEDAIRPIMNGVYFDFTGEKLTIVASDGHKLAMSEMNNAQYTEQGAFIFPKKPASLIKNILPKEEKDVNMQVSEKNAVIKTENFTMTCRLIEGHYPNYRSVIPQNNPNQINVNRNALLSALRRVLIFSNANSALVKLQIVSNRIEVSSQDIDFSMSAQESLICDYNGMPISIGFKGTYLLELLNNLDGEEINIYLADASRAGIFVPAIQPENEKTIMLLMPMMLNE